MSKKTKILIFTLIVIIVIMGIMIMNNKKESNKIEKFLNNINANLTSENTEDKLMNEIENLWIEANNKLINFEDKILSSKMTKEETKTIQELKEKIKENKDNSEETEGYRTQLNEHGKILRQKYITKAEQKKIDEYSKDLSKIGEKYDEILTIYFNIEQGIETNKENELKTKKKEILTMFSNLKDLK